MNTIFITGSAKQVLCHKPEITFEVLYDVNIWASLEGEQLQLITSVKQQLNGYNDIWSIGKDKAKKYFNNDKIDDGAYTQFLDHLVII